MPDIRGYELVDRLQNFYEPDSTDPERVMQAMIRWLRTEPSVAVSAVYIHVGFDGEMPFVEGQVDFVRPDDT